MRKNTKTNFLRHGMSIWVEEKLGQQWKDKTCCGIHTSATGGTR